MAKTKADMTGKDGRGRLGRSRAEKIAAIEGLHVAPEIDRLLRQSADQSGDARRALIMAALSKTDR